MAGRDMGAAIGVGEDGPTHQPVEHLAMLRAIPNLVVLRPAGREAVGGNAEDETSDRESDGERLLAQAANPDLLSELGFEETGIEGYLFPDTYYFPPSVTESEVLIAMVEQFKAVFDPMMRRYAQEPELTPHELLTLASVFLVVTGSEALYNDLGHFGRRPIQAAWLGRQRVPLLGAL